MNLLMLLQLYLNKLSEHPLSLAFTIGFLTAWTSISLISHGTFDPGLGIENLIINGLSILLLFAANSKRIEHHEKINEKIEVLHQKIMNREDN